MPEVSIIMPVYNAAEYLQRSIDSVLTQQFADWELILVDDGSTDDSPEICRRAAESDSRISVITKPNGGLSSARNAGLDCATGRYVTFVDSDDELYPHAISHLRHIAERYSVPVAVGQAAWAATKPEPETHRPITDVVNSRHWLADMLYQKPQRDNTAWGKLYDRHIFDDLRFYDGWYEDLEIMPRILLRVARLATTDSTVYFYRRHSKSFISSWSEGRRDISPVTAKITDKFVADDDRLLIGAARHRQLSAAFNLLTALLVNRPDDTKAIDECIATIRQLRKDVIIDKNARLKNRVAALLSYGGVRFIKLFAR